MKAKIIVILAAVAAAVGYVVYLILSTQKNTHNESLWNHAPVITRANTQETSDQNEAQESQGGKEGKEGGS